MARCHSMNRPTGGLWGYSGRHLVRRETAVRCRVESGPPNPGTPPLLTRHHTVDAWFSNLGLRSDAIGTIGTAGEIDTAFNRLHVPRALGGRPIQSAGGPLPPTNPAGGFHGHRVPSSRKDLSSESTTALCHSNVLDTRPDSIGTRTGRPPVP